ncbi:MAG: glycine zipper family protein [Porticoccaceae bacterium]|nr:glycine zipper family protein [Porticoccaceae bacterium]
MRNLTLYSSILWCGLLAGCATGLMDKTADQVIVDTQGLDLNEYERDLSECDAFAQQIDISKRTVDRVIGGVVVGSVVGAILGNSDSAQKIGGTAGVVGGVKGNVQARKEQQKVIKRCLQGRGYKVLN